MLVRSYNYNFVGDNMTEQYECLYSFISAIQSSASDYKYLFSGSNIAILLQNICAFKRAEVEVTVNGLVLYLGVVNDNLQLFYDSWQSDDIIYLQNDIGGLIQINIIYP